MQSSSTAVELRNKIEAFRKPIYGESYIEKQRHISKNYNGVYPYKAILDVAFCNYALNGSITDDTWDEIVRYSVKLPKNHNRIIQPRVKKCYYQDQHRYCFVIPKYLIKKGQLTNFFFDPMYYRAPMPIFFEHKYIGNSNHRQLIMLQTHYCLNNVQKRSLIMVVDKYPNTEYDLSKLDYSLKSKLGYYQAINVEDLEISDDDDDDDDTNDRPDNDPKDIEMRDVNDLLV